MPDNTDSDWDKPLPASTPQDRAQATTGLRFNAGKPPFHLIDPYFLEDLARVLDFGRQKYAEDNWRKGLSVNECLSSLQRHVMAIQKGEDFDEETGLPHSAHIACNAQFLHFMLDQRPDMDDRWYVKQVLTPQEEADRLLDPVVANTVFQPKEPTTAETAAPLVAGKPFAETAEGRETYNTLRKSLLGGSDSPLPPIQDGGGGVVKSSGRDFGNTDTGFLDVQ